MKPKSFTASLFLLSFIVFSAADACAVIVDFTDMDRGPSTTLHINGVTISNGNTSSPVASLPATVSGIGLGSATIGGAGTVDRMQGAINMRESLSLQVSGLIDTVWITPYFSVVGSDEDIFIPFDMYYTINGVGGGFPNFFRVNNSNPITLTFSILPPFDRLEIGLQADQTNVAIQTYLQEHPGATVQFGFAITSLEYTPADVPEASTVMLFGFGLAGIGLLRRLSPK